MRKSIIFLLVLILVLTGCSQATKSGSGWKTYSSSDGLFEFEYPASWETGDAKGFDPQPEIIIGDPQGATDGFVANINFIILKSPGIAPSAKEQAEATEQMATVLGSTTWGMNNYKSISFEPIKIKDQNAGIYTAEYTISQNDKRVRMQQIIVPLGQKTYVLTFTSLQSNYEQYNNVFKKIVSSVRLK